MEYSAQCVVSFKFCKSNIQSFPSCHTTSSERYIDVETTLKRRYMCLLGYMLREVENFHVNYEISLWLWWTSMVSFSTSVNGLDKEIYYITYKPEILQQQQVLFKLIVYHNNNKLSYDTVLFYKMFKKLIQVNAILLLQPSSSELN